MKSFLLTGLIAVMSSLWARSDRGTVEGFVMDATGKKDGFRTAVREPVLIQAQTRARVDFTLEVGTVTESMEAPG